MNDKVTITLPREVVESLASRHYVYDPLHLGAIFKAIRKALQPERPNMEDTLNINGELIWRYDTDEIAAYKYLKWLFDNNLAPDENSK